MNIILRKRDDGRSGWTRLFAARIDSRRIRRAGFLVIVCCVFLSPPSALSLEQQTLEYPVKLAFLYNFTKFIEWPADAYNDPAAPLTICIVGSDPFSPDLEDQLRTRAVESHPIAVRTVRPDDTLNQCHIVFVPVTERGQVPRIVSGLKGSSALTVGESQGFDQMGGIINFTVRENKFHFEVNPLAAERARLTISSKLLAIATIVKDQDEPAAHSGQ
jgi:hypothetical protein